MPPPLNPHPALGPSVLGLLFSLYLSVRGLRKGLGKFLMGVLESPGKVLDFLSVKECEPCATFWVTSTTDIAFCVPCSKQRLCVSVISGAQDRTGQVREAR